jgi:hypothetical protein
MIDRSPAGERTRRLSIKARKMQVRSVPVALAICPAQDIDDPPDVRRETGILNDGDGKQVVRGYVTARHGQPRRVGMLVYPSNNGTNSIGRVCLF